MDSSMLLLSLLVFAGLFFALSAIIMVLWNGPVMKAFQQNSIRKIDYPTAMGLTFFIMLIMPANIPIYNSVQK